MKSRTVTARAAIVGMVCAAMAASAAACAKAPVRAPTPAEAPALAVPVIPQRVFAPLPEESVEAPAQPEPEEPKVAPARPARPRPRPDRPSEQRPADPAKVDPSATDPVPTLPPPAAAPTPPLRTPQIADDTETGRRIRATIARAAAELGKVNPSTMSSDARMQYETARRFVDQAEGALTARNYMFAGYLADKAEALARGLVGR